MCVGPKECLQCIRLPVVIITDGDCNEKLKVTVLLTAIWPRGDLLITVIPSGPSRGKQPIEF